MELEGRPPLPAWMLRVTPEKARRHVPAPKPAVHGRTPSFPGQPTPPLAQEIEGALRLQTSSSSGFCGSSVLRIL